MTEISNRTLSLLVFATLVVVITSVVVHFSSDDQYYLAGFATTDTGYVNLTINQTLAIQVDSTNRTINFGQCSGYGSSYWCASNDSQVCDANGLANCTGDTTSAQFIRVDNVGNVDASVNLTSECTAATLIGGTSPAFQYIATACNGTGVSSWTSFSTSTANVCSNLSYLGGMLRLYANVTIPSNAVGGSGGGCTDNSSAITFSAIVAP